MAEPPKRAGRSAFERDRARVLHSASLRRLAAKTQVVAVGADFPRTRLTHSLECAQIGRGIGSVIGCDPDLVETACLAHDIGHPPFGHNGEMALADLAAGCGGFEANAQTLRLLTRLETKVRGAGLNLTRASLDAIVKYPWPAPLPAGPARRRAWRGAGSAPGRGRRRPRSGTQPPRPSSTTTPTTPRSSAGSGRVRPTGAVAWRRRSWTGPTTWPIRVHDVEDGLHAGLVTFAQLHDHSERTLVALAAQRFYCAPGSATVAELTAVFDDLMALDCWPKSFDGGPDSLAALKNLTSELVGRFCVAAQDATRASCGEANGGGRLTRYACDLVVPRTQRLECALLKAVAAHYVMTREGAAAAQARERELIAELAATVRIGAPQTLDPVFRPAWETASSAAARRRVVIDQIASLTDTSAIAWHRRLCRTAAARS